MRFHVTADDIRLGRRVHCRKCPVARAVRRRTGDNYAVVDYGTIIVFSKLYEPPPRVRQFVRQLDDSGRRGLKPFRFDLPVPEPKRRRAAK